MPHPEEGLYQRTVRSGFWVFFLSITGQVFRLIRLVILARILAPNDFGLLGVALLVMATMETFSQTGFQQALIQKKEAIESYLDSAWTVLILRGFILFSILYLVAPFAADFFNAPEAKPIIQVIGISLLLQAFTNIGVVYFQKELEFNKQFLYQLSGILADFTVAIFAVLILRNVWALVLGLLAGNAARLVASYLIHPYRPRLNWNLGKAKELFGFGKWILGSSILVFLITHGDDAFVGKFLGASMLGFYQMAYIISNMPATEIAHVISQVTFPAYSKIQDNLPRLREAYLKVLHITAFLSFPIAGLIFILAPDFTKIFLGEKWMPMVPAMQVLALYGMVNSIVVPGPVFLAIGKPELRTKLQFLSLIIMIICIYPFTAWWGITGTAIAVTTYLFLAGTIAMFIAFKVIKSDYKKLLKILLPPLLNTLIMVLIIFTLKTQVVDKVTLSWFFLQVCLGILTYVLIAHLFDKIFGYEIKKLIKERFSNIFGNSHNVIWSKAKKHDFSKFL